MKKCCVDKLLYEETFRAETRHWWFRALHELVEQILEDYTRAKNSEPLKIFDAGCGTGGLMTRLKKFGDIEGIDFSDEAIQYCRDRGLARATLGDLNEWSCDENSFDVITSLDVLYHQAIPDDKAVLKKFFHALRGKGILILNLAAFEELRRGHDIAGQTARRYRVDALAKTLRETGFKVRLQSYRLSYFFFPALIKAWLERRQAEKGRSLPSDLNAVPSEPWNSVLFQINRLENKLIRKGLQLPFGISAFVVAQKPPKERNSS